MNEKVYISGSTQERNMYAAGQGTEEQHMQFVAGVAAWMLRARGFDVYTNTPDMDPKKIVADSNKVGARIHVAIHSNAGGGKGTEVFYSPSKPDSKKLAQCLYSKVAPLSPGADRGLKDGKHLYEIKYPKAVPALIEVEFHDNPNGARWIASHHCTIADGITRAVLDYFGVKY